MEQRRTYFKTSFSFPVGSFDSVGEEPAEREREKENECQVMNTAKKMESSDFKGRLWQEVINTVKRK